jgi:hypothetical protein
MRWITIAGAGLALLAGIVSANAQGIGYGPGVNPSNPQDLRGRSNPQDLSAPRRQQSAGFSPSASGCEFGCHVVFAYDRDAIHWKGQIEAEGSQAAFRCTALRALLASTPV